VGAPPPFLGLVGHSVRWRLLQHLVRSDRAVAELTTLVGEPQSLVSYHLRRLREGGLVRCRQSTADRRDSFYAVDLVACREAFRSAGRSLHPGLGSTDTGPLEPQDRAGQRWRLLFLCTGNSARSQIAEALADHLSGGTVTARSAGSHPKQLHPNAVRVMRDRGIDIGDRRAKHIDELAAERFDEVITLCDRVREVCPEFPSAPNRVHWSIPDPALDGPDDKSSFPAFVRVADELTTRITFHLQLLSTPPTRRHSHAR
jgi:protein-tyrosine-phosphatase